MDFTVEERYCHGDSGRLYGILYRPHTEGSTPLVIYSHGFGAGHANGDPYARALAATGIAVYAFDFAGGALNSQSEGATEDMSVLTEKGDLEYVLEQASDWNEIDAKRIALLGSSQGGFASALVADAHPQQIAALMLLYPAFVIPDDNRKMFGGREQVPKTFSKWDMQVGARYALDTWDMDAYAHHAYPGPVLIIQGAEDELVPAESSRKAAAAYDNVTLEVLPEAAHGFTDEERAEALKYIFAFLDKHGFFPAE